MSIAYLVALNSLLSTVSPVMYCRARQSKVAAQLKMLPRMSTPRLRVAPRFSWEIWYVLAEVFSQYVPLMLRPVIPVPCIPPRVLPSTTVPPVIDQPRQILVTAMPQPSLELMLQPTMPTPFALPVERMPPEAATALSPPLVNVLWLSLM